MPPNDPNNHLERIPLELWYSVFEYAASEAEAQRAAFSTEENVPNIHYTSLVPPPPDILQEELDSPTCFPYAVSSSCRFFRKLAATTPPAWRRIRVFLDGQDPAGTLGKYLDCLERKGLSPTDILVTWTTWNALVSSLSQSDVQPKWDEDQEPPFVVNNEEETRKVQDVLRVLLPKMSQATSLAIQTINGDALPSILHFSTLNCPNLHTLVLDSAIRGRSTPFPASDHLNGPASLPVLLPAVQNLALTGPNFVNLYRSPTWREWYEAQDRTLPRFSRLRVSHYRDSDGDPTSTHGEFTSQDFFATFFTGCLRVGELYDISCADCDPDEDLMAVPVLEFMTVEKVSTSAIKTYLKCVLPFINPGQPSDFVHTFIGCDIGPTAAWSEDPRLDVIVFGYSIQISDISDPDTLRIYFDIAADDVLNLYIANCPGFDDSVAGHLLCATSTGRRPVPNLRALYIKNCSQLSLQALKEVLSELNEWRIGEDEDSGESSSELDGLMDEFYHETLYNKDLDRPRISNSPNDFDYSDRAAQWPGYSEPEDPEDADYHPPDHSSDTSGEDIDSVTLELGPQIRKIQISGGWPSVTQEDIAWFEGMGVDLEVL